MKKIIIIVITLVSVTNVFSQELQVQDLKTRLNYYKTLCDKISENIDCVKRDETNLNQKAKENQQVFNLVKKITKQINDLSKRTEYLSNDIKTLDELLQVVPDTDPRTTTEPAGNAPVPTQTPVPNIGEEETSTPKVETDVREVEHGEQSGDAKQSSTMNKNLERFLSPLSFDEIYKQSNKVKNELDKYGQNSITKTYHILIHLVSIQYNIYNQNEIQTILQSVSSIDKKVLYGNHASELEKELKNLKIYRYATTELQRLAKLISNTNELSNRINKPKDDGTGAIGNSKWDEPEDRPLTPDAVLTYLRENNETEYVDKFAFTRETLEKYIKNPSQRKEIDNALKKALNN